MTDREKILVWLNCYCQGNDNPDCGKCPFQYGDCAVDLPKAIKNLLQEPVKPKVWYHGENAPAMFSYDCGFCNYPIEKRFCYCPGCGRKVMWDG